MPSNLLVGGAPQEEAATAFAGWEMLAAEPADTAGLGWPMNKTAPRWYRLRRRTWNDTVLSRAVRLAPDDASVGTLVYPRHAEREYARMMQLRKSGWVGTQIIQLRGGRREGSRRHPVTRRADATII